MKLAEMLMTRKDILKKVKNVEEELEKTLLRYEEVTDLDQKLYIDKVDEYEILLTDLHLVNMKIEVANRDIASKIKRQQIISREIGMLNSLRTKTLEKNETRRYLGENIRTVDSCVSVEHLNSLIDSKENLRRELDKEIQRYNWQTEV